MNGTFAVATAALVAVLAAIGIASGSDDSSPQPRPAGGGPSIATVARRVERVRRLEFERLPRVRHVSGEQAGRAGLAELDRDVSRGEVLAEQRLLKLLGLLPPDARLRRLLGKALSSEVGGYYVPRTKTLSIVDGGGSLGFLEEITLAHELTHALEDQHFGIASAGATGFRRDRALARGALTEGTATVVMVDYLTARQGGGAPPPAGLRGRLLKQLERVSLPASSGLPRYVRESLVFPYLAGARLVDRIQRRGGWRAVDRGLGPDPPLSSEQLMHPRKYETGERPLRVPAPALAAALPAGARSLSKGDLGEFDTEQLLRRANARARSRRAAAGWGGAAYALWRLPGDCEEPCRERHVLALRWEWDTSRDAREFEDAARRALGRLGPGAVRRRGRAVALVLAPPSASPAQLAALASRE